MLFLLCVVQPRGHRAQKLKRDLGLDAESARNLHRLRHCDAQHAVSAYQRRKPRAPAQRSLLAVRSVGLAGTGQAAVCSWAGVTVFAPASKFPAGAGADAFPSAVRLSSESR